MERKVQDYKRSVLKPSFGHLNQYGEQSGGLSFCGEPMGFVEVCISNNDAQMIPTNGRFFESQIQELD